MKHAYILFVLSLLGFKAGAQACSDLFISEYQEGSSFNKVIEIYNPTTGTIDLSNYRLLVFFNGSDTAQSVWTLSGSLASSDVWVACHSSADSLVQLVADTSNSFVINWNGDDAVALQNVSTGDTIDIIGEIGIDPGDSWVVGSGSTKDHTLVRNADVQEGTPDWSLSSTQWDVYEQNDFSHLGSHTMNPCDLISPSVFFTTDTIFVSEGAGTFIVNVGIINPNGNPTPVDISVTGGSAEQGVDFSLTSPQTISFPANSSEQIMVEGTLVSDGLVESDEVIQLALTNPGNGATITAGAMKVTIVDDDGLALNETVAPLPVSVFASVGNGEIQINAAQRCELQVFSVYGDLLQSIQVHPGNEVINLTTAAKGVYLLRFREGAKQTLKKVIVQ